MLTTQGKNFSRQHAEIFFFWVNVRHLTPPAAYKANPLPTGKELRLTILGNKIFIKPHIGIFFFPRKHESPYPTCCIYSRPLRLVWSNGLPFWVKVSADDKITEIFFLIFPRKQVLTFHANCLQWRQFAWKVKSCFLGKRRKIPSICHLLN